jgi:hypothetical protein
MGMPLDAKYCEKFDKMLGIESAVDGIFVPVTQTSNVLGIADPNDAFDLLSSALDRPWTANENPLIATWLLVNEPALEMITAATKRSRFYAPYLGTDVYPQIFPVLLRVVQDSGDAARALVARAMLHAGEGDLKKAFDDLEATHRLARLVAQDATLVGGCVAFEIDSIACHADIVVVSSGKGLPAELVSYLNRLNKLGSFPRMAERVDNVERLMFVDAIVSIARGKCDPSKMAVAGRHKAAGFGILYMIPRLAIGRAGWDAILREAHTWYDRIAAAMRENTLAEQVAALDAIGAELQSIAEGVKRPHQIAAIVLSDKKTRGELVGKQISTALNGLLLPMARRASAAEYHGETVFDLSRTAIALEIHRASFGQYPESLTPVAHFMQPPPQDRFSGKLLRYERRNEGYLLYSVGPNGKDDGANSYINSTKAGEHVPHGTVSINDGDDLVIRVPLAK